jgi:hypothetical protein
VQSIETKRLQTPTRAEQERVALCEVQVNGGRRGHHQKAYSVELRRLAVPRHNVIQIWGWQLIVPVKGLGSQVHKSEL